MNSCLLESELFDVGTFYMGDSDGEGIDSSGRGGEWHGAESFRKEGPWRDGQNPCGIKKS